MVVASKVHRDREVRNYVPLGVLYKEKECTGRTELGRGRRKGWECVREGREEEVRM